MLLFSIHITRGFTFYFSWGWGLVKTKNNALKRWWASYYIQVLAIFFFFSSLVFLILYLDLLSGNPAISSISKGAHTPYKDENGSEGCDSLLECLKNESYIEFSLLYWKANVGGAEYSYETNTTNANLPLYANTNRLKFPWGYGFSFDVGKGFVQGNWDVGVLYTYYNRKGSVELLSMGNSIQVNLKGTILADETFRNSFVNGHVEYDNIDLYLRKHILFFNTFCLSPAIGIRTSWLDISQEEKYTGGEMGNSSLFVNEKSGFWGIGPAISGEAKWFIPAGFYLKSLLGMAVEYGPLTVKYKESFSSDSTNQIAIKDRARRFLPNFDYDLSIGYGQYVNDSDKYLNLELGFSGTYWFNGNNNFYFHDINPIRYYQNGKDVNFYGLKISASLQF